MRVALVGGESAFEAGLRAGLLERGYAIQRMRAEPEALRVFSSDRFDCVLLEMGHNVDAGERRLAQLRSHNSAVGVIVASEPECVAACAKLVGQGADDFILKPIELNELHARIRLVAHRSTANSRLSVLEFGQIRLSPSDRTVTLLGHPVVLSTREFRVLEFFLRNQSRVLSRQQLEASLYGRDAEVISNTVEVYIHGLRRKFGPDFIHTIRGFGYQLAPAQAVGSVPAHRAASAPKAQGFLFR